MKNRDPRIEKIRDFRHSHGLWSNYVRKNWGSNRRAVHDALRSGKWNDSTLLSGSSFGFTRSF